MSDMIETESAGGNSRKVTRKNILSGGGGLYDTSKGVPLLSSGTLINTSTYYSVTENAGKAINSKYLGAGGANSRIGGVLLPRASTTGHWAALSLFNGDRRRYYGPTLGFHNTANGRYHCGSFFDNTALVGLSLNTWSDPNTRVANTDYGVGPALAGPMWHHIKCDGTTMTWGWSRDGKNVDWYQTALLSAYISTFDRIFLGNFANGTDEKAASVTFLCYDDDADNRAMGL
jgi:hypothetical protein